MVDLCLVKGKFNRDAQARHFGALVGGEAMDVVVVVGTEHSAIMERPGYQEQIQVGSVHFLRRHVYHKIQMMMFNLECFVRRTLT